jgi:hypothetical protein
MEAIIMLKIVNFSVIKLPQTRRVARLVSTKLLGIRHPHLNTHNTHITQRVSNINSSIMAAVTEEQMEDDMAVQGPLPLARLEVYDFQKHSNSNREMESRQVI